MGYAMTSNGPFFWALISNLCEMNQNVIPDTCATLNDGGRATTGDSDDLECLVLWGRLSVPYMT